MRTRVTSTRGLRAAMAAGILLFAAAGRAEAPAQRVSFQEGARVHLDHAPVAVAVTSLTSQSWPDLVVMSDSIVTTLLGERGGGFGTTHDQFVAPGLVGLAERGGDVVVSAPASGAVFTLHGAGDGTFAAIDTLRGPWAPGVLALTGYPGLSGPALVVADLFFQAIVLTAYDGSGGVSFQRQFSGFIDPVAMAVVNVDRDGVPDLVVADQVSRTVSVLSDFAQGGSVVRHDVHLPGRPVAVAVSDLNGDGYGDVIVTTRDPGALVVLLGEQDGSLRPAFSYAAGTDLPALVVADFDRDDHPDVAVADRGANSIGIWLGVGDGSLVHAASIPTDAAPTALDLGEMNAPVDFWLDLVCANRDGRTVQVFLNTTSPPPGAVRLFAPSPNPTRARCTLSFVLSTQAQARIEIHDLTGRLVRRLEDPDFLPGTHHLTWDGRTEAGGLAHSGLYFARVRAGGAEATTRIVLER